MDVLLCKLQVKYFQKFVSQDFDSARYHKFLEATGLSWTGMLCCMYELFNIHDVDSESQRSSNSAASTTSGATPSVIATAVPTADDTLPSAAASLHPPTPIPEVASQPAPEALPSDVAQAASGADAVSESVQNTNPEPTPAEPPASVPGLVVHVGVFSECVDLASYPKDYAQVMQMVVSGQPVPGMSELLR